MTPEDRIRISLIRRDGNACVHAEGRISGALGMGGLLNTAICDRIVACEFLGPDLIGERAQSSNSRHVAAG